MFTSAQGHYSVDKSAMVMGIGTNQVIKVPCDEYGRIIPSELG
jgi:glutamate/tyrosine decarboxylase-like PLP-dependent enzyme